MKRLATIIACAIVGVAIGHAVFSFYWLSFDPATWTADARFLAINAYIAFPVILYGVIFGSEK
jgi:hypothetical protein